MLKNDAAANATATPATIAITCLRIGPPHRRFAVISPATPNARTNGYAVSLVSDAAAAVAPTTAGWARTSTAAAKHTSSPAAKTSPEVVRAYQRIGLAISTSTNAHKSGRRPYRTNTTEAATTDATTATTLSASSTRVRA